jgi:acyl-CoA thioesterase-1
LACNVLLLGDSISSGYGITTEKTWANILKDKLNEHHADLKNLSVSGYTSKSGLEMLNNHLLNDHPDIVIVELGGNDALQFIAPSQFKENLINLDKLSEKHHFSLVILGIRLPPNMPPSYREAHQNVYLELLKKHPGTTDLLKEVIEKNLFQADQIHPNNEAQLLIFKQAWPHIQEALKKRCHEGSQ